MANEENRSVNEVVLNGESIISTRKDTVAEDNLLRNESATDKAGKKIKGELNVASADDTYNINDPVDDIEDEDYIPFNDVSDVELPKKKTLFSTLIEKLTKYFLPTNSIGGKSQLKFNDSGVLDLQLNDIDASKTNNNVTSTHYPTTSNVLDKARRIIMRTEAVVSPSGGIGWKAYVRNYNTSGENVGQKGIQFHMNKSGNLSYQIDDARAFREAIGTMDVQGSALPSGTVIDDYHTSSHAGVYYFADDGVAGNITTLPEAICGKLIVTNNGNGGFTQYYLPNHSVKFWIRVWWSNTWTAWTDIVHNHTYDVGAEIPANANLNTYTTAGTYYIRSNAAAQTIANCPDSYSGKLIVLYQDNNNGYRLKQIYLPNGERQPFIRHMDYGGTFYEWSKIPFSDDSYNIKSKGFTALIPANANLNNYTTSGTYDCITAADAQTLSNCPVRYAFKLMVDVENNTNIVAQTITLVHDYNAMPWYRVKNNDNTWGAWKEFASFNDISPSNIGLGYAFATVSGSAITATITGFKLRAGVFVSIKINSEMSTACTLNINNTGAKNIKFWNDEDPSFGKYVGGGKITTFIYDGTYYRVIAIDRVPLVGTQSYVADTSGNILLDWGYNVNRAQIKYNIGTNKLLWNYYKNSAWRGDVTVADYDDMNPAIAKVGKSILPSWSMTSNVYTNNGITYTFNPSTGEITANGTASNYSVCIIAGKDYSQYWIPKGTYTLSGCPSGGSGLTYRLQLDLASGSKPDYGSGNTFTLTSDQKSTNNEHLYIRIESGQTVSNVVFKPMLRPAWTSADYEPCEDIYKGNCYVGTCTTAAGTKDKVAYVDGYFVLRKGVRVAIKFSNTNTYSSSTSSPVTLNVNGTGAKNIWYSNTHSGAGNTGTYTRIYGVANRYVFYIYDGTYWVWDSYSCDDNTDIRPSAYCETAAGTAAKVASCTEYQLLSNSYLHILMRYANSSASALTLNVNGKGAKPIYINGAASSSSNYTLPAGTYIVYYDGTNYYFRTDGNIDIRDNIKFRRNNTELFFNKNYVSGESGNYGLNIVPYTDKNDRAAIKIYGNSSAPYYNFAVNGSWKGDGLIFNKWFPNIVYCTSTTAAGTAAKVATTQGGGKLVTLVVGMVACVVHSNNNTASNCTLNIDGTGAKQIYYNQSVYTGSTDWICGRQNMAIYYMYDGTYWRWIGMGRNDNSTNFLRNDASSTLTASGSAYLSVKSSSIDLTQANNGVESTHYPAYIIQDKNGRDMTRLETVVETNGQIRTYLQVCNYNTTSASHFKAGISMYTNKSQDMWYGLSNPHYFHRELGFGYGTCSTAADQRVKEVSMPRFRLVTGGIIGVKFTNTNTYSATADNKICLNVNGTGEKPIYYNTGYPTGTNTTVFGLANRVHYYMYDGSNWCWLNAGYEADTVDPRSLGFGYGTCDTAEATTAKVVSLGSYTLRNGGYVTVKFTYAVPANATMNINSKGAKNIWYRGANITANVIKAGDLATFIYDGTRYQLVGIDRDSTSTIDVISRSNISFCSNLSTSQYNATSFSNYNTIEGRLLVGEIEFTVEQGTSTITFPAYSQDNDKVFCKMVRPANYQMYGYYECHVNINQTIYPAVIEERTLNNVVYWMISLRKQAQLSTTSGRTNIRIQYTAVVK